MRVCYPFKILLNSILLKSISKFCNKLGCGEKAQQFRNNLHDFSNFTMKTDSS